MDRQRKPEECHKPSCITMPIRGKQAFKDVAAVGTISPLFG
jgi:hypothetical protein